VTIFNIRYEVEVVINKLYKYSIVAYRPVAKEWLYKQRPLLSNTRNIQARNNRRTMFSMVRGAAVSGQQLGKHAPTVTDTKATTEEWCFLCGGCRNLITTTVGFDYGLTSPREAHLTLNGRTIPFVNYVKYVGIILDKRTTWRLRVETIEAKAFRILESSTYLKVSV
jgi:hypothetical protein